MLRPHPLGSALARVVRAGVLPWTPVLAQLVVTRRCNLACGYCTEYDGHSDPVDLGVLLRRVDRLAGLHTIVVTLTGGEPLLHPRLDDVVQHAVDRGTVCTVNTNGYPLTREWIKRLNRARLTLMQISVDNLTPSAQSEKSWSRIERQMRLLRDHARFSVNVNAVLGACAAEETLAVASEVADLGFYLTVGVMHDAQGRVSEGLLGESVATMLDRIRGRRRTHPLHAAGEGWESRLVRDGRAPWKCRAGSRFLYVDEHGLVSYCSQRRGTPGLALDTYDEADLRREFATRKGCEDQCTVACVRRASAFDRWRHQEAHPRTAPGSLLPS